jgi:hypothetical protein
MVVDRSTRSAEPSRIVQWRLPTCATVVTQFVTPFGAASADHRVTGKRWSSDPQKRPAIPSGNFPIGRPRDLADLVDRVTRA